MKLHPIDMVIFTAFSGAVLAVEIFTSRRENGRGLPWWLIGFLLIAGTISTEQFIGMSGNADRLGLAIASCEWLVAISLVVMPFFFLLYFLRAGPVHT